MDSFPEQLHKPGTDHGDFINVFGEDLMQEMVDCINSGRTCGAGVGEGGEQPDADPKEEPTGAPGGGGNGGKGDKTGDGDGRQENPSEPPAGAPATEEPAGDATAPPGGKQPEVRASGAPTDGGAAGAGDQQGDEAGQETPGVGTGTNDAGRQAAAAGATEPRAVSGGLAETGAQLWSAAAAAGAVLVIAGFVLLRRVRRT